MELTLPAIIDTRFYLLNQRKSSFLTWIFELFESVINIVLQRWL